MYKYCGVLPIDSSDMLFYTRYMMAEDEAAAYVRERKRALRTIERAIKSSHKAKTHPYRMKLVLEMQKLRSLELR